MNIYKQLEADEGVVYKTYMDHLGHMTFGIGHKVTRDDKEYWEPLGTPVTEKRVREVFAKDLDTAMKDCAALYGDDFIAWPEEVKEVLVNMMFNLGRTRLRKFKKMKAALMRKDWKKAAEEGRDSLWAKQVPNRAERLMTRLENVT